MPRYPVNIRIKIPEHIPFGQPDPNAKHGKHAGDDSANGKDTQVFAPASGTVFSTADSGNQGIAVQIFDGKYYPHVFHLNSRSVNIGDRVTEGQPIGKVGNTGLSTGYHIHFGVGKKPYLTTTSINDYIDPMEYIKGQGGNMPSYDGEVEFNNKYIAFFGPMENNPPTDGDRNRWVFNGIAPGQPGSNAGTAESNTVTRAMQADPRHNAWLMYIEDLKKAAVGAKFEPVGFQVFKEVK